MNRDDAAGDRGLKQEVGAITCGHLTTAKDPAWVESLVLCNLVAPWRLSTIVSHSQDLRGALNGTLESRLERLIGEERGEEACRVGDFGSRKILPTFPLLFSSRRFFPSSPSLPCRGPWHHLLTS